MLISALRAILQAIELQIASTVDLVSASYTILVEVIDTVSPPTISFGTSYGLIARLASTSAIFRISFLSANLKAVRSTSATRQLLEINENHLQALLLHQLHILAISLWVVRYQQYVHSFGSACGVQSKPTHAPPPYDSKPTSMPGSGT